MHREITKGTGSLERSLDTISNNLHTIDQVCNFGRISESVIDASSRLPCSLYQGNSGYTAASLVGGRVKTNPWDYDILWAVSPTLHSPLHLYGSGSTAASLVTGQVKTSLWASDISSAASPVGYGSLCQPDSRYTAASLITGQLKTS